MWVRSPLGAQIGTPNLYFMSVTAHGVAMAYVLTTFFIMGFGYFVAVMARVLDGGPQRGGGRCRGSSQSG
jgi:heme/copper-type cytochrome/quinol oxidase subunit 1